MRTRRADRVSYACPRCRAGLEAEVDAWKGWRTCPACGEPGLPPDPRTSLWRTPGASPRGAGQDAEAWISEGDADPWDLDLRRPPIRFQSARARAGEKWKKIASGVGLAVAFFCLLIGYLDLSPPFLGVGLLVALGSVWLRVRRPPGPGRDARRRTPGGQWEGGD